MDDTITPNDTTPRRSPGQATRRLFWLRVAVLGGLAGLLVAGALVVVLRRGSLPRLTAADLEAARTRWESRAPRDYTIEIQVRGAQPAVYRVEVIDAEPVSAERNGIPIRQQRSWETWSVPGMFGTLASDVDNLREHSSLVVRCQFDTEYGYPARYERIELGTGQQVSWEVTKFDTNRSP